MNDEGYEDEAERGGMVAPLAQVSLLALLNHLKSFLTNARAIRVVKGDVMGSGRCLILVFDLALRPSQDLITVITLAARLGDLSNYILLVLNLSVKLFRGCHLVVLLLVDTCFFIIVL